MVDAECVFEVTANTKLDGVDGEVYEQRTETRPIGARTTSLPPDAKEAHVTAAGAPGGA